MRCERKYRFDASRQIALSLFEQISLGKLCDLAARLDTRHWIPATSSNLSLRRDPTSFLISRSGKHKRGLHPSDFLLVDLHGKPAAAMAPKPSDETLLHALIYRRCPWISCIIHCHAPELEHLRPPSVSLTGHELLKALGHKSHETGQLIHVYENSQDMHALSTHIEQSQFTKVQPQANATSRPVFFVLAQHGIYCGGATIDKAEAVLEALLHLLKHSVIEQHVEEQ
jgi:methylthioribulose-1-phosphate dehydratase